ncbi:MAG: transcription factor S [Halobacteriaceae archaeon]
MRFCGDCGSMMKTEDDQWVCTNCGATEPREDAAESFVTSEEQDTSDVIETEEDVQFEGQPTAEVSCDECGNDEAYYYFKQTASADEPPTRFFKCTECGHQWREYN